MNKKAIIAVLSALVLTIVASVTLILTVGQKASADTTGVDITEYCDWTLNEDGNSYTLTKYNGDNVEEIYIPDTYMGKPVTVIGEEAFAYKDFAKIHIPSTITSIGHSAFSNCNFDSIIIPDSVTEIGSAIFGWNNDVCVYCELSQRPDGWEGVDDELMGPWFWYGEWYYNEHHEPEINYIEKGRLDDEIYWDAYGYGLSREGINYCYRCNELTFVYGGEEGFQKDSGAYTSPVAWNAGGGSEDYLDFGCNVTAVEFEEGVTSIGAGAFAGFNIDSLVLPDTVEEIGDYAFDGLNLKELVLPSALKRIGCWGDDNNIDNIIIPSSVETTEYGAYLRAKVLYFEASSLPGYFNQETFSAERIVLDCYKTVTFDVMGGSSVASQKVCVDHFITEPTVPTKAGYTFKGWYNGEEVYDFNTPVIDNLTLTAQWEAIPEPEPSNPEPTEPENQEQNNETTPTEQESTEMKENKNNGAVIAVIAGTSGVVGVTAIGTIVGVVLKKRRK